MKNLLFALVLLIASIAEAQDMERIAGKWKVVRVDNGVAIDFRTNAITVSPELAAQFKDHPDSARVINMYLRMDKKYSDYYFNFRKDGLYEEIMKGEIRNPLSTYRMLESENIIYMRMASDINDQEQHMNYEFLKDGTLQLKISFLDETMTIDLEKVPDPGR